MSPPDLATRADARAFPQGRVKGVPPVGMVFTREGGQFAYAHEWDKPDRAPELGAIAAATLARKGARRIIAGIPH